MDLRMLNALRSGNTQAALELLQGGSDTKLHSPGGGWAIPDSSVGILPSPSGASNWLEKGDPTPSPA
eukprot:440704-Hanusia_phi.AAC.1